VADGTAKAATPNPAAICQLRNKQFAARASAQLGVMAVAMVAAMVAQSARVPDLHAPVVVSPTRCAPALT